MAGGRSLWDKLADHKNNILDLPPLERLVLPVPAIMSGLLRRGPSWIVGPPKIGKTVVAHYAAYLTCLWVDTVSNKPCVMTFDGGPECSRAVDLVLEAPYSDGLGAVVFENPFGADAMRPNSVFLRQLKLLIEERPEIKIFVTTRPGGYLKYRNSIEEVLEYRTPLAFSEWYSAESLLRYAHLRGAATLNRETVIRLGAPALVHDFIFHSANPGNARQRATLRRKFGKDLEDVTLDKLALLRQDRELGLLAGLVRLQEYAYSLPSVEELSRLSGFPVEQHPHLGLVAIPYTFDGLKRLRFEHATAREAADLLLRTASEDDFADLRAKLDGKAHLSWVERSIELWSARQDIVAGNWDAFHARDEEVRGTLVTDVLSLSGDAMNVAVNSISQINYDAWTAQDIAYEIAAGWPEYSEHSEVRRLVRQLLMDADSDGAYAMLEALLYVRSPDVQPLWGYVDSCLVELSEAEGEPPKQLLLAVDGLAWRPPPEWHSLGIWAQNFLARLTPTQDAFAFIRFMIGYHPEGLAYLRMKLNPLIEELVSQDSSVRWTFSQAELASWLIQWHFIHQCRARAQLARQPWIDQQFLCRSFHPDLPNQDHEAGAAILIRSLRESGADTAGWGFFLAENLRAVAPQSYGEKTAAEARLTLRQTTGDGLGVIAAVLTYSPAAQLLPAVREYFRQPSAVNSLMTALNHGLTVAGTELVEPRFAYRRDLSGIYTTCGLDWPDIKACIPAVDLLNTRGFFDVNRLISNLEDAAKDDSLNQDPGLSAVLNVIMSRVKRGDLTALRPARNQLAHDAEEADGVSDRLAPYHALLRSSVVAQITMTDDRLSSTGSEPMC